uniref:Teneurin N-terminal domain-containing protein n=1 Tax=Angiostrongylus cantonensis TaxID=6313 RepID=A0A0K0DI22_ANGCA
MVVTVTAPRLHKGHMSCPGGYKESYCSESMDRLVGTEIRLSRERRDRNECTERKYSKQRTTWDTSEYRSDDPPPLANYPRNSHYNEDLGESDDQAWNLH